jgi:transcriptional regulator with XRE-family HTH domain
MAHPLDVLVGKRLHQRRSLLGMTTQQLGDSIGVTSRQIDDYETGTDRISARRIWDIAAAIEVPVLFFFEGLDGQPTNTAEACGGLFTAQETLGLVRAPMKGQGSAAL